jgi:hypothetical protein
MLGWRGVRGGALSVLQTSAHGSSRVFYSSVHLSIMASHLIFSRRPSRRLRQHAEILDAPRHRSEKRVVVSFLDVYQRQHNATLRFHISSTYYARGACDTCPIDLCVRVSTKLLVMYTSRSSTVELRVSASFLYVTTRKGAHKYTHFFYKYPPASAILFWTEVQEKQTADAPILALIDVIHLKRNFSNRIKIGSWHASIVLLRMEVYKIQSVKRKFILCASA